MSRRLLAVAAVPEPGGAEIGLLRLTRALAERGWDVTVTAPAEGAVLEAARDAGHRAAVLPVGGLRRGAGARAILAWPRVRRMAADVDVVYLNGTVSGRLLPALPRGPVSVLHVHDVVDRVPRHWRSADRVLADSGAVAAPLARLRPAVVGCPVDPDPPAVPAPWPPGDGPVVGFVGRIEPRKGPLDLVAATPAIRDGAPGVRVVLVGDARHGADPGYATRVEREAQAAGVERLGWIDGAAGLMRHLAVLVLPSRQEPFGTVLAEAMAVGTPVVATDVGGLAEVVDDGVTGALVPPGDPAALAAAVLRVLRRRDELGAAARDRARRFHVETYADRIEELVVPFTGGVPEGVAA
jgi:glycosyltransferase involved in cell wall biosynthesis